MKDRKIVGIGGEKSGFTFLEVMTVLTVIAILAAIAVPNILSWLPNMRLKSAARDLFSNMQKIRSLAVRDNANRAIVFDTANNRYILCQTSGADGLWSTLADNSIISTVSLSSYGNNVKYGHGVASKQANSAAASFPNSFDNVGYAGNVLVFNSRGTANAGYVYLDNQNNNITYAVGTIPSGVIRLLRWGSGNWK